MVTWEGIASLQRGAFVGGASSNAFFKMWLSTAPKSGNPTGKLFNGQEAITNAMVAMEAGGNVYGLDPNLQIAQTEPEGIRVPVLTCQSWSDQGVHNPDGFEAWQRLQTSERYLYTHGRKKWDVFYNEAVEVMERFFEHHLKGIAAPSWAGEHPVRVEVRETATKCQVRYEPQFPLQSTQPTMLFLSSGDRRLAFSAPASAQELNLELDLSRGELSFEHKFERDTELTGYMSLKLFAELKGADDAEVYVRVEKLTAGGEVVFFDGIMGDPRAPVAIGEFRLSHHVSKGKPDAGPRERGPLQPWYTHEARAPLKPGEVVEVDVPVRPSSTLFRKEEQLRLIIQATGESQCMMNVRELKQSGTLVLHGNRGAGLLVPVILVA